MLQQITTMFQAIVNKFTGKSTQSKLEEGAQLKFIHTAPKTQYTVIISTTSQEEKQLHLKLQQKYGLTQWKVTYSQLNIEQITKKTGHQLAYQFFTTLLVKALEQRQLDCYIDILTTEDLQILKNRKNGNAGSVKKKGDPSTSKRYLILSYMTNDTKYHFPLSLSPVKIEYSPQELKNIYNKLRIQLEEARSAALNDTQKSQSFSITYNNQKSKINPHQASKLKEIDQHKSQNEILKAKLARLEEQIEKKKANIEIQAAIQKTKLLKQSIQTQNLQLVDWKNNLEEQQNTHSDMKKQLVKLHKKICGLLQTDKQMMAKKKGQQVEKQLNQVRNLLKKNTNEIDKLKKELQNSKAKAKEYELKAKKLNSEKEVLRKGRRGPYSSAGSVRSYGSYNSNNSSKRSTGGYSASSSKPKSNYSYNSYSYGRR